MTKTIDRGDGWTVTMASGGDMKEYASEMQRMVARCLGMPEHLLVECRHTRSPSILYEFNEWFAQAKQRAANRCTISCRLEP